jgi:hypothetical protein
MTSSKIIKYKSKIGESEMTEELLHYLTLFYIFCIFLILDILKYIFTLISI